MFSKACEYGIRAAIYIAQQSMQNRKSGLKEIAEAIASPEAFTSKILQTLVRHKVIYSEKGPSGGFAIDLQKLDSVKLSHIVKVIDGDGIYKGCGLGLKACNEERPCPVHDRFKEIRNGLRNMLETTSVLHLALGLREGLTFLKQ
jgi:Rrf2 family iron-sulfur cluster assembly transcriptional regulator